MLSSIQGELNLWHSFSDFIKSELLKLPKNVSRMNFFYTCQGNFLSQYDKYKCTWAQNYINCTHKTYI